MIMGVDHIALSCNDLAEGLQSLRQLNCEVLFREDDLPNHKEKRSFLKSYEPRHAVAYCRPPKGIGIELTRHASPIQNTLSPYQVLFQNVSAPLPSFEEDIPKSWAAAWTGLYPEGNPTPGLLSPFHAQCWYDILPAQRDDGMIRAILVPVSDLIVSEKFWVNGLGCEVAHRAPKEDWLHLRISSPVPEWCLDLVLVETTELILPPHLDDAGFPCLALLTNRLEEDRARAIQRAASGASEPFSLEIAKKKLNVALLRGPDGELVELIEIQKNGKEASRATNR